jgi:hypothetical protein
VESTRLHQVGRQGTYSRMATSQMDATSPFTGSKPLRPLRCSNHSDTGCSPKPSRVRSAWDTTYTARHHKHEIGEWQPTGLSFVAFVFFTVDITLTSPDRTRLFGGIFDAHASSCEQPWHALHM